MTNLLLGSGWGRVLRGTIAFVAVLASACSEDDGSTAPTTTGAVRGGAMYDTWWKVKNVAAPTGNHPLWATRPDMTTNTLTGADTWRCKECHGWDYKGVLGAYATGSHRTGFAGILGITKTEPEIVDSLKTKHGYGAAGLTDGDLQDLAKFVRESLVDVAPIIDAMKKFTGDATKGKAHFDGACAICHGMNGLADKPTGSPGMFGEYPGLIANDNPYEFQHKVRFGQPPFEMPPQEKLLTLTQVGELGAYAQTLPKAP